VYIGGGMYVWNSKKLDWRRIRKCRHLPSFVRNGRKTANVDWCRKYGSG